MVTKERFKELCEEAGCYYPEWHIVMGRRGDTPLYMRLFFEEQGREQS